MTWKSKLPEPKRSGPQSPKELAVQLDVTVNEVTDALAKLGEHTLSARSKTIEPPTARAVAELLSRPYEQEVIRPATPWTRRDVGPPRGRQGQRRERSTTTSRPTSTPSTFTSPDNSLGLGSRHQDASPTFALEEWKLYEFSEAERDAWLAHGLRPGQAQIAKQLRDSGILASDLGVTILGWTAGKRLAAGESPGDVRRLLLQANRDAS